MTDKTSPYQSLSSRLKFARQTAGLTQGQAARELGWHRPTISEIEAGRRKVKAEEITKLADLYGVSSTWLIGEEATGEISDKVMLAARELSKLGAEDLDRVLKIVRTLRA